MVQLWQTAKFLAVQSLPAWLDRQAQEQAGLTSDSFACKTV